MVIQTAIIKNIEVKFIEHVRPLVVEIGFKTVNGGFGNIFTLDQVEKMMEECNVSNLFSLIGKPCECNTEWGKPSHFIKMWKE